MNTPPEALEETISTSRDGPGQTPLAREALFAVGTVLLLIFCTWGLIRLRDLTHDQRPYTILYLIPVAIAGAFLGVRGGIAAAVIALILSRVFLFSDSEHGSALFLSFPRSSEAIEFSALLLGTFTMALATGRLRTALDLLRTSGESVKQTNHDLGLANARLAETNSRLEVSNAQLADANALVRESEEQRRVFHRDVLLAVTGGKLRLVEPKEMPPSDLVSGTPMQALPLTKTEDASRLRRTLEKIAADLGMDAERVFDLCTGTTEAATNAIKHGSGGQARIWADRSAIAVEITDQGGGIAPAHLARATLQQGYSTRVSLGMGFHLMLQTSDVLALSTTPQGTSVLLRVSAGPRISEQDALLARYVGL